MSAMAAGHALLMKLMQVYTIIWNKQSFANIYSKMNTLSSPGHAHPAQCWHAHLRHKRIRITKHTLHSFGNNSRDIHHGASASMTYQLHYRSLRAFVSTSFVHWHMRALCARVFLMCHARKCKHSHLIPTHLAMRHKCIRKRCSLICAHSHTPYARNFHPLLCALERMDPHSPFVQSPSHSVAYDHSHQQWLVTTGWKMGIP